MSLKKKTINGVLWNGVELFGGHLIQFVIVIILARLLAPEDFGVIGLLIIFMELAKVLLDSGFSQALIRKQDADQQDFTSIFYFNIAAGIVVYVLLFIASPSISAFYNFPELTNIARISFLAVLINSFGIVQNARIMRSVNFKILAKRTIISATLAGIIAIVLAFKGFGVWALIIQSLLASLFRVVLLWSFSKWLPSLKFTFGPIKEMFGFSVNLLASGVLDVIVSNLRTLLIGKFYTRADLGYYTQANRLMRIPADTMTSIVRNVTYPVLSTIQDNIEQLKQAYRKIIAIAFFVVFPLMLGLMAAGDNLVFVLIGEKWRESIEYFRLMCLIGAILPLYSINQNIFLVRGKSKMFLKLNIVKRVVTITTVLLTISISVYALVVGQVVANAINTIITMIYSGREINYSFKEQLQDLFTTVIASAVMALLVYWFGYFITIENRLFVLMMQAIIALSVYLSLAFVFKLKAYHNIREIFMQQLGKKVII